MINIAIITGGGDVPPLNALISFIKSECVSNNYNLYGVIKGWSGLLDGSLIKLNNININPLIGGTILKSSRVNITKEEAGLDRISKTLNIFNIDYLIVIGGEDTLSNAIYLKNFPKILISKTIDNDVGTFDSGKFVNFFTLGFPTAVRKISSIISLQEGLRTTAYSHERIIVVESMGMHAGWLALSSCLGNPDFLIIPEFKLNYDELLDQVKERYIKQRNVIIVISEGARWKNGMYISADEKQSDDFGHPKFIGAANVLAIKLKSDLKNAFDVRNINSVNPSYLYRSGKPAALDLKISKMMALEALRIIKSDLKESTFLTTSMINNEFIIEHFKFDVLGSIEQFHRFIDSSFYDEKWFSATKLAKSYFSKFSRRFHKIEYNL